MVCINWNEDFSTGAPWWLLNSLVFCFRPFFRRSCYHAHQRDRSPAGHSLSFHLLWGAGTNSRAHCNELVTLVFIVLYCFLLFAGLDDVLSRSKLVEQRPFRSVPRLRDTSDKSGDESCMGEPNRRLRSKRTYKMKKAWGASDVGQFFVTGPTDVATKPSQFYCSICRKDVFVLNHGHHETLRHFQDSKHFPRDQRLRLEPPG